MGMAVGAAAVEEVAVGAAAAGAGATIGCWTKLSSGFPTGTGTDEPPVISEERHARTKRTAIRGASLEVELL